MIAVQLYSQGQVAKEMEKHGCVYVRQLDERHDIWKTDWGFHFIVPVVGDERYCPKIVLFEILADIERTRPATP